MRNLSFVLAALFCVATVSQADDTAPIPNPQSAASSTPAASTDAAAAPTAAAATAEPFGASQEAENTTPKPRITFDGETYVFAWEGTSPTAKIKEFLPPGQDLDTWTKFVAINEYPHVKDARDFAHNIVHTLQKSNPQTPAHMHENSKTGDVVLDFVTWPEDKSYVEFNVFKFHKLQGGGLVGEQYAQRAYTEDDQKLLLDRLEMLRKHVLPLMDEHGLQTEQSAASLAPTEPAQSQREGNDRPAGH